MAEAITLNDVVETPEGAFDHIFNSAFLQKKGKEIREFLSIERTKLLQEPDINSRYNKVIDLISALYSHFTGSLSAFSEFGGYPPEYRGDPKQMLKEFLLKYSTK